MKKYRQVNITRIYEEDGHESEETIETLHTIRSWDELTDEEKEEEIKKHFNDIYEWYQDSIYNDYKWEIDILREDFKNISFDDIYLDSNSQGGWIDSIKGFKLHDEGINIYGENLWIDSVDFTIRRDIENFDIIVDDYYVDADKMTRIMETKKYKKWIGQLHDDIQKWVDRVNEITGNLLKEEYNCPSMLNNAREREYLDAYFEDMDFESVETLHNETIC